jgi:hypothetical protein
MSWKVKKVRGILDSEINENDVCRCLLDGAPLGSCRTFQAVAMAFLLILTVFMLVSIM